MSHARANSELRGAELAADVTVQGIEKVQVRRSSITRACDSEACARPTIVPGTEFVRVVYEPGRPPEFFHPPCFRYEFT